MQQVLNIRGGAIALGAAIAESRKEVVVQVYAAVARWR